MTDLHEAGVETRPAVLGDRHVEGAVAAAKGLVASAREIGRALAGVAEGEHSGMNIDDVISPESQFGTAAAEARPFARAAAQGRGRK